MLRNSPLVLIVDRRISWGPDLMRQFVSDDLRVLVVASSATALAIARSKPLAAAIIDFDGDFKTGRLNTELMRLGVKTKFSRSPEEAVQIALSLGRTKPRLAHAR